MALKRQETLRSPCCAVHNLRHTKHWPCSCQKKKIKKHLRVRAREGLIRPTHYKERMREASFIKIKLNRVAEQEPCPDLTEFLAFGMEGLALELQGIKRGCKS